MSDYNRGRGPEYSNPYGGQPQPPQGGSQPYPSGYEQDAQQDQYGYGSQPYGQQPYAQQPYPPNPYPDTPQHYGGQMLPEHPNATMILALGIIGITVIGLVSPFAWWQGNKARREIRQGLYRDSGLVTVGWITGIIGSVILMIVAVLFIIYLILALWVWTTISSVPG